jgi:all-trans-8'-apo-beta-carotenal 15,15'-oxygenase
MTTSQEAQPRTGVRPIEPSPHAAWLRAHRAVAVEHDDVPLPIEGTVPDAIRGVLFRNGPGKLEAFGTAYAHPFDGDGMITRFAFGGSPGAPVVRYRNRFVRTREYLAEAREGRALYRGFGTNLPGGFARNALRMRFKNVANTSLVWHAGRLLALWEAGLPHRIDPVTLETLARDDLDGVLRPASRALRLIAPEIPFSAHPKLDPRDGSLVNFGVQVGAPPKIVTVTIDADGRARLGRSIPLDAMAFVHDFVLTPRWMLFYVSPVAFDLGRTLLGISPPSTAIRSRRGHAVVLMVPRDGGPVVRLEAQAGFVFHFAGAFERDDGTVVLDGFRMDRFPLLEDMAQIERLGDDVFPPPRLVRWILHPVRKWLTQEPIGTIAGELPTTGVGPFVEHRYVYAIARHGDARTPFFTGLQKIDVRATGDRFRDFAPDFPSEPIFVPRPGATAEDDGWLLSLVYESRAGRSALLILRADDLSTVARMPLPDHVPPGFHGIWVSAEGGPAWASASAAPGA